MLSWLRRSIFSFTVFSIASQSVFAASFATSKRLLERIYKEHPETFYCGCAMRYEASRPVPDLGSCSYTVRKQAKRANRIEWEHVVPASILGGGLACWENGGRKACKRDKNFSEMESDLHNLVPSIGEVNGDRSNRRFGIVENEPRVYGACDFEIDYASDLVEPRVDIRGDIARIWKYARARYSVFISDAEETMFDSWDKLDPVSDWECRKDQIVLGIQGSSNEFVSVYCN